MFLMCVLEFSLLLIAGFALIFRLPLLIGHAIDERSRLFPRYIASSRFCCIYIPIGKAIPAETRKIHQIDVLHLWPRSEVLDETAQNRRLELGLQFRIDSRHGLSLSSEALFCSGEL